MTMMIQHPERKNQVVVGNSNKILILKDAQVCIEIGSLENNV